MTDMQARATSFGAAAAEYDRGRPTYPAAALEWMIPTNARVAVDVGAGTGKFTRLLHEVGLDVTAVDPDAGMLQQLRSSVPGVATLEGTAEHIPLPDSSADVVTFAQAWHWVDDSLGFPEVGRVLRDGGTLALVWNFRNNAAGWHELFGEIVSDRVASIEVAGVGSTLPPFGEWERAEFDWVQTLTRRELVDLVKSRSVFLVAEPEEQQRVLAALNDLLDTHPDVAGRSEYELPYRTYCFRAVAHKSPDEGSWVDSMTVPLP
jgi:ubiquinone/menaquinone biosynthesis C-methylase UbiE